MNSQIRATFNGKPITAADGSTVGGALVANGIVSWRNTRQKDRPRGLFCGIGVCFDCLVEVDGQPNERACMVRLREGMSIAGVDSAQDRGRE
ncbi:(2Fe-2S)-binding protein [Arthrobacter yangruifuii]|uniref:(2Fe-2S)-binding protein n=1 Tax=Arthrobacter yangruifuii TaxID=2606616 RepID=UPI0011B779CF|nr:(2Fe-2S)-binding protein [Arthrobacter yangruifuii]